MQNLRSIGWDGCENEWEQGRPSMMVLSVFGILRISGFQALKINEFYGFWALALRCRAISNGLRSTKWLVELISVHRSARRVILLVAGGNRARPVSPNYLGFSVGFSIIAPDPQIQFE